MAKRAMLRSRQEITDQFISCRLLIVLAVMLIMVPSLVYSDTIILKKGKGERKNVVIVRETFAKIEYRFRFKDTLSPLQMLHSKDVAAIKRDNTPFNYQSAEKLKQQGLYPQALKEYQTVLRMRDWSEQHCRYNIALCHQKMQAYDQAVRDYQLLLKKFPDTYYKAMAYFNIGICHQQAGRKRYAYRAFARAAGYYRQLEDYGQWVEANYWQGVILHHAKKYQPAIGKYKAALSRAAARPELSNDIQLQIGHCLLKIQRHASAKNIFLGLIKNSSPSKRNLMSGAYFGLGECYLARQQIEAALLCFLRVVMLYQTDNEYTRDAYQQAADCCQLLQSKKPEYRLRAQRLRQMGKQRFQGS